MATTPNRQIAEPQQPELRAFIVYDHVPPGCIAHQITDERSAPILRPGDVVLIDTRQREPMHRELFLIAYTPRSSDNTPPMEIVEAYLRPGRYGSGPNGEMIDSHAWFVGAYNRPRSYEQMLAWGSSRKPIECVDGPYATEGRNAGYLQEKLRGRVVGILEPAYEEPKRITGEVRATCIGERTRAPHHPPAQGPNPRFAIHGGGRRIVPPHHGARRTIGARQHRSPIPAARPRADQAVPGGAAGLARLHALAGE